MVVGKRVGGCVALVVVLVGFWLVYTRMYSETLATDHLVYITGGNNVTVPLGGGASTKDVSSTRTMIDKQEVNKKNNDGLDDKDEDETDWSDEDLLIEDELEEIKKDVKGEQRSNKKTPNTSKSNNSNKSDTKSNNDNDKNIDDDNRKTVEKKKTEGFSNDHLWRTFTGSLPLNEQEWLKCCIYNGKLSC